MILIIQLTNNIQNIISTLSGRAYPFGCGAKRSLSIMYPRHLQMLTGSLPDICFGGRTELERLRALL